MKLIYQKQWFAELSLWILPSTSSSGKDTCSITNGKNIHFCYIFSLCHSSWASGDRFVIYKCCKAYIFKAWFNNNWTISGGSQYYIYFVSNSAILFQQLLAQMCMPTSKHKKKMKKRGGERKLSFKTNHQKKYFWLIQCQRELHSLLTECSSRTDELAHYATA